MPTRLRIVAYCFLLVFSAVPAFAIETGVLQRGYDRVAPALGLVQYTVELTNPATNEQTTRDNEALGVVVSPEGLVIVYGHMLLENVRPFNIRMRLNAGDAEEQFRAELVGKPDDVNLVFLQLQSATPLKLPYVRFKEPSGLALAEPVAIIGMLGENFNHRPVMLETRVGAVLDKPRETFCLEAPVQFGYVTGPVLDEQGAAVGLVGFDMSRAEGGDLYARSGQPLIYQSELFTHYIKSPPGVDSAEPAPDEAWLGVLTQPLTDDLAKYWNLPERGGLVVSTVVPASPAAEAGLEPGDVITEFNGIPITYKLDREVLSFTKLVRDTGTGKSVKLDVVRNGKTTTHELALVSRPRMARDAEELDVDSLGFTVRELTADVRMALNLPAEAKGVIVQHVRGGSPAQLAGMRPGVIILALGGRPITNLAEFTEAVTAVEAARPAELAIFARMGPTTGFFRIEPRWRGE